MEKVKIEIYCYLIADILTKVLQKCSWRSPLQTIWILSKSLILIDCHDNRNVKFLKKIFKNLLRSHKGNEAETLHECLCYYPLHKLCFCRTSFSMGDLGMQVSTRSFIRPSIRQHLPWVSCERNSSYSFVPIVLKLCRCFCPGLSICMWFGYICWVIFCHFFPLCELSHFSTSMYRQWVPCEDLSV